jgi:hypothetical protein
MDKEHRAAGKRERINPTGTKGSSRYVRRDPQGRFTSDQSMAGRSVTSDRLRQAKYHAPKGQKDRGD